MNETVLGIIVFCSLLLILGLVITYIIIQITNDAHRRTNVTEVNKHDNTKRIRKRVPTNTTKDI